MELPPHTEVLVSCKAKQSIKHFGTACGVAQSASNSWQYAEDALVIGSTLMAPNKATHYILVMNQSNATRTLHEGTQLFPVESLKQVQKRLCVYYDFSNWESDDEELSDVRAAGTKGRNAPAETPRVNARDVRMDQNDLPEHLHPLMQWIAKDISMREREELAAVIYEYRDMFSSVPEDMAQTDLITHY